MAQKSSSTKPTNVDTGHRRIMRLCPFFMEFEGSKAKKTVIPNEYEESIDMSFAEGESATKN